METTNGTAAAEATSGQTHHEARAYTGFARRCKLAGRLARGGGNSFGGEPTMPTALPITLVAAGGAAIINFWLATRIGAVRTKAKISIGDGGDPKLIARMRAQANFVEYTPIVLVLIAAIELSQGSSTWLWVVAALYLLGRVAHGLGMDGFMPGRLGGTLVTMLTMLGLGIYALVIPFTTPARAPTPVETSLPTG